MSIHETRTKSGTKYQVKLRTPDGRQYAKTFSNKTQAKAYQTSELNALNTGAWIDNQRSSTTFGLLAKHWLEQNPDKRLRTLDRDKGILNKHILPIIEDKKLKSIKRPDIQSMVNTWSDQGLKPRTIKRHIAVLRAIFQKAIDEDLLNKSPVRAIKLPKAAPVEHHPLTEQEVVRLLEAIELFYRPLLYIAITTGLRWSELAGLQIGDASLLKQPKVLSVERGLHRVTKGFIIEKPKSDAGKRQIMLSDQQAELIAMHLRTTKRTMANQSEPLFVSPNGHEINYSNFRNRVFIPACKKANISNLRIHDLRRTTATVLVGAQVDAKTIQEMMGHSDIRTTLNLYASATPQGRKKASAAMDEFMNTQDDRDIQQAE